ncbi:MAG TPA: hypothetical protein VHS59_02165 [Bacillota bacterium]|nr:hypothetical protein [Bacillota bacterium]
MERIDKTLDPAAGSMINKASGLGIDTVWDRFQSQQPQCGFGSLGLCCRHCDQGPCRIIYNLMESSYKKNQAQTW